MNRGPGSDTAKVLTEATEMVSDKFGNDILIEDIECIREYSHIPCVKRTISRLVRMNRY
jgi:hypothetical protein